MSKAFDRVNRNLLFHKLLKKKINGKLYFAIKALYTNTLSAVRINNELTNWFVTDSGVRQGDNLSPVLFNIYLNDLAEELNNLKLGVKINDFCVSLLLYADDIVLLSENEENLRKCCYVHEWCQKWQMTVNIEKTKVLHFCKKRTKRSNYRFSLGNELIENVSKFKYLGVIFDEFLNFKECANVLADSAGRALSAVISKCFPFKYASVGWNSFTKLYDSTVYSIMSYSAEVWNFRNHLPGQKIKNRAIRYFLGVHKNAPILGLQSEMGWLNVKFRLYLSTLRYWNRLMTMDYSHLTRKILEYDLCNYNNENWSGHVYRIAKILKCEENILQGEQFNLQSSSDKLYDEMHYEWSKDIPTESKLRNYVKFNQDIEASGYLKISLSRFQRSLMAQLRLGILPLALETGRYYRIPIENRFCKLCQNENIEDEIQFLCCCKYFDHEHLLFFTKLAGKLCW